MASADFWPSISTPLGVDSTRQIARSPRVLRTHLHAYARRIYVAAFRTRIGLHIFWPACPATPPTSASCSSRQRFASGFLQIPSRPGHPCLPLTLPRVGCVEDLHLQVSAPCRAHQQKGQHLAGLSAALSLSLTLCGGGSGRDRRGRDPTERACRAQEPVPSRSGSWCRSRTHSRSRQPRQGRSPVPGN
jgi:hypothetical protein